MNQNVKITRQQAAEEAKMLEKVFDVVRFLRGFLTDAKMIQCIGAKIECVSACVIFKEE